MGKLSTFLIVLVLVSLCVGVFSIFLAQMSDGYGEQSGMSEDDLGLLNKMESLSNDTKEIQNNINTFSEKDSPFDIIGNFFSSAWSSVKLAGSSVDLVAGEDGIIYTVADKTNLGEAGILIRNALVTIMIIFVVVSILMSALIKREM